MVSEDVNLRLTLSERRQTAAGLAEVRSDLDQVADAGDDVARSGNSAARSLARLAGRGVLGALNTTRRGLVGLATGLTRGVVGASKAAATGLAVTGVAVGALSVKSLQLAADAKETGSAFNTVFGPGARGVRKELEGLSKRFGLYLPDLKDGARQFGVFGKAAGMSAKDLPGFSTELTKAALDLSSFYNVSSSDSLAAIQSGLSGEAEPLRRFGIFLSDAAMKAQAAQMGLTDELTEQQKVMVRHKLIMKGLGDAEGDMARTSQGLANQQRGLMGRSQQLARILGGPLSTAATGLFRGLNMIAKRAMAELRREMPGLNKGARSLSDTFEQWGRRLASKIPGSIDRIIAKSRDLRGTFNQVRDAATSFFGGLSVPGSTSTDLASIGSSLVALGPAFQAIASSGINNILSVTNAVFGFFAKHVDTLVQLMPLLVAAFVAVKAAQFAANVVTAFSVPLRIAEIAATRAQTAALRANTSATGTSTGALLAQTTVVGSNNVVIVQNTVSQGANTTATNTGIIARVRATASWVAQRVAMLAVTVALYATTAALWLMNAATAAFNAVMALNPIALVVIALIALGVGLVVAYKKSETFRNIVNGAFTKVRQIVSSVVGWFKTWVPQTFSFVAAAIRRYVTMYWTVVKTAFKVIRTVVTAAVSFVVGYVRTYLAILKGIWSAGWSAVSAVVGPVWNTIRGAVSTGVKIVTGAIRTGVATAKKIWGRIEGFVSTAKSVFDRIRDVVSGVVDQIKDIIQGVVDKVQSVFDAIDRVKNAAGKIGGKLKGGLGFSTGGTVPGTGRGDIVPSMLEPREFVVRRSVVERPGVLDFLKRLNGGTGDLADVAPAVRVPSTVPIAAQRDKALDDLEAWTAPAAAAATRAPEVHHHYLVLDGKVVAESTWSKQRDAEARA